MLIFIFYSHLKMTSERSTCRGLLSLTFITKCISKKFLINYWCYWLLVFTDWYLRDVDGSYRVFSQIFFSFHRKSTLLCMSSKFNFRFSREAEHRVVHNFSNSWQKFLSSRIVVIKCRRRSLLGGSGSMVPQEIFTF